MKLKVKHIANQTNWRSKAQAKYFLVCRNPGNQTQTLPLLILYSFVLGKARQYYVYFYFIHTRSHTVLIHIVWEKEPNYAATLILHKFTHNKRLNYLNILTVVYQHCLVLQFYSYFFISVKNTVL